MEYPVLNLYLVFSLLLGQVATFGQTNKIDSLYSVLKTAKEDSNKVSVLIDLSNMYRKIGNYDTSLYYANNAKTIATAIELKKGIANAYNNIGLVYKNKGNYPEALKNLFVSLKIDEKTNDKNGEAISYNNIGIVYMDQGNYPEALKNYFSSLKLREEIGDKKGIAYSYGNIGLVYQSQGNYPEALKNHFADLKTAEEIGDKGLITNAYNNIGIIYTDQGNYPEALKNLLASLKIREEGGDKKGMADAYLNIGIIYADQGNYSEALKSFFASLKISGEIGDKEGLETSLENIGETYKDVKNYGQAEEYSLKGLNLATEIGDKVGVAYCCLNLGQVNTLLNRRKEAQVYLNKAFQLIKEVDSKLYYRDIYLALSILDSAKGDFKSAFTHHTLYYIYKDSINNEKSNIKSLQIANQYQSERKEKEIAQLNLDVLTKQKDVEEKNNILYSTIAGSALLVILGFLFFSRKQLQQKNRHQIELTKQQELNAIAVMQAQETERNSISKDLHDGVGTFLSTLKLNMETLENSISSEKTSSYENALQLIDTTSVELRNVMNNLSSETLQEHGLVGALDELIGKVNYLGNIHIDFQHHGIIERLDDIIEVNLYRVAQELITNCIKHAQATHATLQLIDHEASVLLMLEDNGKGFNTKNTKQHSNGGMGLKNISNRVAFIKGTFKVESVLEKGTTSIIETPKNIH